MRPTYASIPLIFFSFPALAQDVTFRCGYPFGDQSLGIYATNPGPNPRTCQAVCEADRKPADPDFPFEPKAILRCSGDVPPGGQDFLICSRGDFPGSLSNARISDMPPPSCN
jgi:hypothetical protein